MRVRLILLTTTVAIAAACTEHPASTGAARPVAAISDGAMGGNAHFFFLPPMVANPHSDGGNDDTQSPVVVICQLVGATCGTTLATFTTDPGTTTTTQPGNSETVRTSAKHYFVDWHTGAFALDPALTYRICVRVGAVELGFADVDVVASGRELREVGAGFVAVRDGRTLPIKFRIEQGALEQPQAAGCGTGQPE